MLFSDISLFLARVRTAIHAAMPPQMKPSRVEMGLPFGGEGGADMFAPLESS